MTKRNAAIAPAAIRTMVAIIHTLIPPEPPVSFSSGEKMLAVEVSQEEALDDAASDLELGVSDALLTPAFA